MKKSTVKTTVKMVDENPEAENLAPVNDFANRKERRRRAKANGWFKKEAKDRNVWARANAHHVNVQTVKNVKLWLWAF
jgi:hypothetical protein